MNLTALSHVALLVNSVDASAEFLSLKGIKCGEAEVFESEGTKEVYVGDYQDQSGLLLLLEPIGEGPYKRAMSKRGPSLHHIALDVLDMKAFLTDAAKAGWEVHPVSNSKTSWLFQKGLPLLEIHERKILSVQPLKISEIELPDFSPKAFDFLKVNIKSGSELSLVIDGKKLSFSQITSPPGS